MKRVMGPTFVGREREVLVRLAAGRTTRQIGEERSIGQTAASVHVTHLLRKRGVASRIEATAVAQRLDRETP